MGHGNWPSGRTCAERRLGERSGLGLRRQKQRAERLDYLGAVRPFADKRRIGPRFAAATLMAAVQHEWQAALCQSPSYAEVGISQAIFEVQHGGGELGLLAYAQALAEIRGSTNISPSSLQNHLKTASYKWLVLNYQD